MNRIDLTAVGGDPVDTLSLDLGSEGSPGAGDVVVAAGRFGNYGDTAAARA